MPSRLDLAPRDLEDDPGADDAFRRPARRAGSAAKALQRPGEPTWPIISIAIRFRAGLQPHPQALRRPGEAERDFKVRCQQAAREARDKAVDKLRDKYDVKLKRLEERLAGEEEELAQTRPNTRAAWAKRCSPGLASVAGALGVFGRRSASLSGLSTAAAKRRMTSSAKAEHRRIEAEIARLKADIEELKSEMEQEANALTEQWAAVAEDVEQVKIDAAEDRHRRANGRALAWAPSWEVTYEDLRGRSRHRVRARLRRGRDRRKQDSASSIKRPPPKVAVFCMGCIRSQSQGILSVFRGRQWPVCDRATAPDIERILERTGARLDATDTFALYPAAGGSFGPFVPEGVCRPARYTLQPGAVYLGGLTAALGGFHVRALSPLITAGAAFCNRAAAWG